MYSFSSLVCKMILEKILKKIKGIEFDAFKKYKKYWFFYCNIYNSNSCQQIKEWDALPFF